MHVSLGIVAVVSALNFVSAVPVPQAPVAGVPFRERVNLVGDILLDDSFLFDTDLDSAVSTQVGSFGVDYLFKCGSPSKKGPFDSNACAEIISPLNNVAGCTDNFLDPFAGHEGPKRCVAQGSTGLTHFTSNLAIGKEEISGISVSNACGFLGGRCGDNYDNAQLFILGPTGGFRNVDIRKDSFGMVKIYNS